MKGNLLTLLVGVAAGVGLGLIIGWVLLPVEFVDVTPAALDEEAQADYLRLVAATYAVDGDFGGARARLLSLGRGDLLDWVRAETVDAILRSEDEVEIRHLVRLAADLGISSPAMGPYLEGGGG